MTGASYVNSDMSRLTTMLTRVGVPFERSYGPDAIRLIEIGNVSFEFRDDGKLIHVGIKPEARKAVERL